MRSDDLHDGLTISELAQRSGVSAGTLRMWETRHGFPEPRRTGRGHRRYDPGDVERVQRVLADRTAGMSLTLAIRRAVADGEHGDASLFSELRRLHPHLEPHVLAKPALLALSVAIEDECCVQAERPLLYAFFQRECFYRQAERRWREFARTAEHAFVFADFPKLGRTRGGPVEVPMDPSSPMAREWALVCDAPRYAVCLVGWERPETHPVPERERKFEAIWSLEPSVVRQAALVCNARLESIDPKLAAAAAERLGAAPASTELQQLRVAAALSGRMAAYLSSG